MSAEACRATLEGAEPFRRAPTLDETHPGCACEAWSLAQENDHRVADDELIARVLTAPTDYDEETGTILTTKLCDIWSIGLSTIRQGASDDEILATFNQLTVEAKSVRTLAGAIVVQASELRTYDPEGRWFGVYATDDRNKAHHVDVLGTTPTGSKSAIERAKSSRRHALVRDWSDRVILSGEPGELLTLLRQAGI